MKDYKVSLSGIIVIVSIIAVILFFGKGCFTAGTTKETVKVIRDTQYIPQPPVTIPQYQPIIVETKAPTVIPQQYQPSNNNEVLLKQYQDLLERFLSSHRYNDSIPLHDSSGNRVGVVNLEDAVSENKIQSRNPSYSLRLPVITNTVTIKEAYQPRNQWFYGVGLSLDQIGVFRGFDAGISVINKKGKMLQVSGQVFNGGKFGGRIGYFKKF